MGFLAVKRGKFRQLADAHTRGPVDARLYAMRVERVSRNGSGKTFVTVDAGSALGDMHVLREADAFIRRAASPRFSPLDGSGQATKLTLKVLATTAYADSIGHPAPPFVPETGDVIDAVVRPGAFGEFGYCLLVQTLKPHAVKGP